MRVPLSTLFIAVACFGVAESAVSLPQQQPASARVVDAITLAPVSDALIALSGDLGADVGLTDADGRVEFAAVALPGVPLDEGELPPPVVRLAAAHADFLPLVRDVVLNEAGRDATLPLVPRASGTVTPLIDASEGARLQLTGVGALAVPPGVLSQDARLRVIVVPPRAWTPAASTADLVHQVWLEAIDASGDPLPALPAGFSGIELTVDVARVADLPAGLQRSWRSRSVDAGGVETGTQAATAQAGTTVVTFAVADGFTQLDYVWDGGVVVGCEWGPWALEVVPVSSTVVGGTAVSVNCGIHANAVSVSVTAGETKTSSHTLGGTIKSEFGWDAGTLFAKASAELGVTITGSYSSGTATTTMVASTKATPPSGTINGQDQGDLGPPWSCVSGTATYGVRMTTYALWASRRCVHPDGSIEHESERLGSLTVPGSVSIEWDADIDSGCGSGCGAASMPDLPQ